MTQLRVLILGSAAGGGLPQWNCGCENCDGARRGDIPARSQSSIAVSVDAEQWALINASPDLRMQLQDCPPLYPRGRRGTPIASVLVTNGDIDHIAGLLTLREKEAFSLYATSEIHAVLDANPIFNALDRQLVARRPAALNAPFELLPGLTATLFPVPGKVPLYMEEGEVVTDLEGEQTVGVELSDGTRTVFYIPGCAHMPEMLAEKLAGAELVLFDGTLWTDDEMIRAGLGVKTGRRMGHMPISGEGGSIEAFEHLRVRRKMFVHINNSNPVVDPARPERHAAEAAGWEIAEDGLEIVL